MRPWNPDQKRNLKEKIDEWIEQGVIKPANSPCAPSLVPVKKKDGRTIWVTDLRLLNSVSEAGRSGAFYRLLVQEVQPAIDESFRELSLFYQLKTRLED